MSTTAFTITDLYCGAGGSTTGAAAVPGAEVRRAINHWDRAVETMQENHPTANPIKSDLLDVHPACFEPMTMLLASPECKTHSPGSGQRRKNLEQGDLFDRCDLSPEQIKSRATMWTVVQWASVHHPAFVVVENVVGIHYWPEFAPWLREFERMGYDHERVYVNGLFVHGLTDPRVTFRMPQSRDRIYVVFWRKGNPRPDLSIRPLAPCPSCASEVQSVQAWKPGRTWGKYGAKSGQYVYRCPSCTGVVEPWYHPASTAIDWTIPSVRIGEREAMGMKPLVEKTIARIEYGLKRFGLHPYTVATRYSSGVECRVRDVDAPMPCQPTQEVVGLAGALAVELGRKDHAGKCRPVEAAALATQTTAHTQGLVYANRTNGTLRGADQGMHTVTTGTTLGLLTPCRTNGVAAPVETAAMGAVTAGGTHHGLVTTHRGKSKAHPTEAPLTTATAHTVNHGLVTGAQVTLRGTRSLDGIDAPIGTACATAIQTGLVTREPFVVSYYGTDQAARTSDPLGTVTTLARHALVDGAPAPRVEDLYFRMFDVPELLVGTGYALDYRLFGTKRDRVRLIGGSNYSGIEQLLVQRCMDTLG